MFDNKTLIQYAELEREDVPAAVSAWYKKHNQKPTRAHLKELEEQFPELSFAIHEEAYKGGGRDLKIHGKHDDSDRNRFNFNLARTSYLTNSPLDFEEHNPAEFAGIKSRNAERREFLNGDNVSKAVEYLNALTAKRDEFLALLNQYDSQVPDCMRYEIKKLIFAFGCRHTVTSMWALIDTIEAPKQ